MCTANDVKKQNSINMKTDHYHCSAIRPHLHRRRTDGGVHASDCVLVVCVRVCVLHTHVLARGCAVNVYVLTAVKVWLQTFALAAAPYSTINVSECVGYTAFDVLGLLKE